MGNRGYKEGKDERRLSANLVLFLTHCLKMRLKMDLGFQYEKIKDNDANVYGYDNYDPCPHKKKIYRKQPSIKSLIIDSKVAMEALEQFRSNPAEPFERYAELDMKYLWKKVKKAQELVHDPIAKPLTFHRKYLKTFFAFLEIRSLYNLEQMYDNSFMTYVGFYYSKSGMRMRNMAISVSGFFIDGKKRLVKLEGLQINGSTMEQNPYIGEMWDEGNWRYMTLHNKQSNRRVFFTAGIEENVDNPIGFKGVIQATTTRNEIFSGEVFFVPIDNYKYLDGKQNTDCEWKRTNGVIEDCLVVKKEYLKDIYFYLALMRNNISVSGQVPKDLNFLEAGHVHVNLYTDLVGEYRLWNFDTENNKIVQSIFEITEQGLAMLKPFIPTSEKQTDHALRNKMKEQFSVLNVSRVHQGNRQPIVIATTFAKDTDNIVNIAMFEHGFLTKIEGVYKGKFITLGLPNGIVIESFAMAKKKEGQTIKIKDMHFKAAVEEAFDNECVNLLEALVAMKESAKDHVLTRERVDVIRDHIKQNKQLRHIDVSSRGAGKE